MLCVVCVRVCVLCATRRRSRYAVLLVVDRDVEVGRQDGAEVAERVTVDVHLVLVTFEHSLVQAQHVDDGLGAAGSEVPLVDAQPQRRLDLQR